MHFSFLFALHKSLSSVGVSTGVLRGTWKHLESKWEWKVLFERVEYRSRQRERPTTPAPDETKAARHPAAGFSTCSEPTPRRQLSRVGVRSATRAQKEEMKCALGETSCSGVRYSLRTQLLVDNFRESERPRGARSATRAQYEETKQGFGAMSRSEVANPLWKQSDLVERLHEPARVSLLLIKNLCFIWAFQVVD
uniref:Uncharacterized protein n=1 Tax=Brassica oleracea var. oleracea TaxID=109376 RepID=A0A0D3AAN2_BRAOL